MVASLIAAGYILGEDVIQKARDFDTRSEIMTRFDAGAEAIKTKAQQLDEEYKFGDKLKEFGERVTTAVKNFDEKVKLSETVERAIAHPTVQEGINKLKTVGAHIGEAVKTTFDAQVFAVEQAIEERYQARAAQQQQQHQQQEEQEEQEEKTSDELGEQGQSTETKTDTDIQSEDHVVAIATTSEKDALAEASPNQ